MVKLNSKMKYNIKYVTLTLSYHIAYYSLLTLLYILTFVIRAVPNIFCFLCQLIYDLFIYPVIAFIQVSCIFGGVFFGILLSIIGFLLYVIITIVQYLCFVLYSLVENIVGVIVKIANSSKMLVKYVSNLLLDGIKYVANSFCNMIKKIFDGIYDWLSKNLKPCLIFIITVFIKYIAIHIIALCAKAIIKYLFVTNDQTSCSDNISEEGAQFSYDSFDYTTLDQQEGVSVWEDVEEINYDSEVATHIATSVVLLLTSITKKMS